MVAMQVAAVVGGDGGQWMGVLKLGKIPAPATKSALQATEYCARAQAQWFERSAVYCAVPLGLVFGESCFWGVGCGRAIGICISGWVFVTSLS